MPFLKSSCHHYSCNFSLSISVFFCENPSYGDTYFSYIVNVFVNSVFIPVFQFLYFAVSVNWLSLHISSDNEISFISPSMLKSSIYWWLIRPICPCHFLSFLSMSWHLFLHCHSFFSNWYTFWIVFLICNKTNLRTLLYIYLPMILVLIFFFDCYASVNMIQSVSILAFANYQISSF